MVTVKLVSSECVRGVCVICDSEVLLKSKSSSSRSVSEADKLA